MRNLVNLILTILCVTLFAISIPSAIVQSQVCYFGKLKGIVAGQQDAVITRATVIVKNSSVSKQLSVDQDGHFVTFLPSGKYEVIVEADGFKNYRKKDVLIRDDETVTLNVTMKTISQRFKCKLGSLCL